MKTKYFISFFLAVMIGLTGSAVAQEDPITFDPKQKIMLNFRDAQVADVLEYLSKTVGLIVVSDMLIDGRITVISEQPLDVDRAISLLNTIIKEKEYAAIRVGQTLKIVSLNSAKQMSIPVHSGSDPDKIVAGDEVVTHIIPIRYVDATKLKEDLTPLIPEYAELSANQASNSLILTDTTANIKRIVQIVRSLDTQVAAIAEVRVFHLVYADAENTADLINEVFKEKTQSTTAEQQRSPFSRMMGFGGRRGGPGEDAGNEQQGISGGPDLSVTASADTRTNTVVVSGPADTMDVIEKVIKELDSNPQEERSIFVYPLENAQAVNLKEVLNNLFQQMQQINQQNISGSTRSGAQGGRNIFAASTAGTGTNNTNDFSDEVYVEADEDKNALLVMTSSKNYEKIRKIIEQLDEPAPQVLIKVLLAEVTVTDELDLGVEFSVLNIRDSGGQSLFETDFPPINVSGGFKARILEGDLDITLRALAKVGKLNVLSRPYILTSNNQTAKITVGQEVPFIRDTRTTETGQTINTIEYEDIGIILEVTPYINPAGLVIMDVKPEISTTTAETVPISETVNAAVFAKRSSESRVAVVDGQTIVIGGLMQNKDTDTVQKVPLLGDTPILDMLFKRTINKKEKTELLIFLTPQVASKSSDLKDISEHERTKSDILKNIDQSPSLKEHIENMESLSPKE
jgi:general secretion pathway protein D